ncbi:MAG: aldo/keto reductase [Actinobacteria bacterium HGW-Actinobacteria-8]|nr:MAG: aldo/keto reductase [Actinobacteria bacterium HGW-Actinobacteria-8]
MRSRRFGRLEWDVSEIGFGMFGMGSWSGADDDASLEALQFALDLGCNFFDSAWGYGAGRTDRLLGQLARDNPERRIHVASKIPPRNLQFPAKAGVPLSEAFPRDHIREFTENILEASGLSTIDLLQFHVWNDEWADDEEWQRAVDDLRSEGLVGGVGISINRWEPRNSLNALRTGLIDAVQVIYNVFDQAPEDELFPVCVDMDIAVICRVPFDEGTLTGSLRLDSMWPADDWRSTYFVPENLASSVAHAEALRGDVPPEMTMPELALRFILSNPAVSTVIPGMRSPEHIRSNFAASDAGPLSASLISRLRSHRWDREPTWWSQ